MCDKRLPEQVKGRIISKMIVRPTMLYEIESVSGEMKRDGIITNEVERSASEMVWSYIPVPNR